MVTKEALILPGREGFRVQEGSNLSRVLERLNGLRKEKGVCVAQTGRPIVQINPEKGFAEWIEFFVAPPEGIFDAKRLENFRHDLFPDFKSGLDNPIRQFEDSLELGYFAFDDKLLHRRREVKDTVEVEYEPGAAERLGLDVENSVTTRREDTLTRRTFVKVYPHIFLAEVVARMKNEGTPPHLSLYFSRLEYTLSKPQSEKLQEVIRNRWGDISLLYREMQSVARQEEAKVHSQYLR